MQPLTGIIPAAGKGVRARPYTHEIHKGMLPINGVPNLERLIGLMRDDLGIRHIVLVIGYLGETIRAHFGAGDAFGVTLDYVENRNIERGWAWSVHLARRFVDGYGCVMLCDECYVNSNHDRLRTFDYTRYAAVCAGLPVEDAALIKKNYAIERDGERILALREKPATVTNDLMGSGTFVLSPSVFDALGEAFNHRPQVDFVTFLNDLIREGRPVGFFELKGAYVNINDRDSLHLARYHDRMANFPDYGAALLICAEGDETDVTFTINRHRETGFFNRIAVVMPAHNSLHDLVLGAGAEALVCPAGLVGFGERMRYGLAQLEADILIVTEADYSFSNRDVEKLLCYLKEADMVVGTRTTRQLIEQGCGMHGVVRMAHATLGRLLQWLWWNREGRFTDTGCTFRALWKTTFRQIEPSLTASGPEFLAEMVIESLNQRLKIIEIPVNYFNRSQSQNRRHRNPKTFFRILLFLFRRRWMRRPRREAGSQPNRTRVQ